MISSNWQHFLKEKGPALNATPVLPTDLDAYRSRLPPDFLEFCSATGWASYMGGRLTICHPGLLHGVLDAVFRDDPDLRAEHCLVYAFTVFGQLYGIHDRYGAFDIDLISYKMTARGYLKPKVSPHLSAGILAALVATENRSIDPHDESERRALFPKARKALGLPDLDECYGFVPALPIGGVRSAASLRRLKAREHFLFLAQIKQVTLMDYDTFPGNAARLIG